MPKLLSALVGVSMLGLAGAANAGEPPTLSDAQLDSVSAGQVTQTSNVVAVGIENLTADVGVLIQALNTGAGSITSPVFNQ